jgi:hypothetical protein
VPLRDHGAEAAQQVAARRIGNVLVAHAFEIAAIPVAVGDVEVAEGRIEGGARDDRMIAVAQGDEPASPEMWNSLSCMARKG